jgi:multiple sugar transport system substrate-binding protein
MIRKINQYFLFIGAATAIGLSAIFSVYNYQTIFKTGQNGEVVIHFADNISPAHQQRIDAFNSAYKGRIRVETIDLPFSKFSTNQRKEILARSLRSKSNRIDVFTVDVIWVPRFARWSVPLENLIEPTEIKQFIPQTQASCYYNDKLMAVPFYFDIGMMYYRRDLLAELPNAAAIEQKIRQGMTWNDFIALHKQLKHTNRPFFLFPANNYEGLICSYWEMLEGKKATIFDADSIRLDNPASIESVAFMMDLIHEHKMTPAVVSEFNETKLYQYALENDALFYRGWPGNLKHIDIRNNPLYQEKLNHTFPAALPFFADGRPVAIFGGWNLMISKFSDHKEAAMTFIRFLMQRDNQEKMYAEGGYLPAASSVYEDRLFIKHHPELDYYMWLFKRGRHRPYRVDYTRISDVMSYYIQQALKRELLPQEALRKATVTINAQKAIIR